MSAAHELAPKHGRDVGRTSATDLRVGLVRGTVPVDYFDWDSLSARIADQLRCDEGPSLTITSVNLDHVHHYRDRALNSRVTNARGEWVFVADGWPIAWRASRVSGREWPRLPGSDILPEVLRLLDQSAGTIAVVGGTRDMHRRFVRVTTTRYERVRIVGMWAPHRHEVLATEPGSALDQELAALAPDVVLVALPKPLSEQWITRHARDGDSTIFLPFGAAADFLSGHIRRAPKIMQRLRLEWLFRLIKEPRRMARRYLVQGPASFARLLTPSISGNTRRAGGADSTQPDAVVISSR